MTTTLIGTQWVSTDRRDNYRKVEIIGVSNGRAHCRNVLTGRITYVATHRLRPGDGWQLVSPSVVIEESA